MCRQWVNQATVSREHLLALAIPLPPLNEQQRIAAILDAADALRAKRRATWPNSTPAAMRRLLFMTKLADLVNQTLPASSFDFADQPQPTIAAYSLRVAEKGIRVFGSVPP